MVKAIYSLKMFLFQHQFTLTTKQKHSVKELALFVSLIYVQFWHEAPLGRRASLNDMQLLESLTNYPNRTIAKAARDTFLVFFRVSRWPFFLWWQNCSRCENMDSGKPLNSDMWSVLTDHLSYCILWAYQAVLHKELLWFSMSSVQTARWRHIISWLRTPLNGYWELYRQRQQWRSWTTVQREPSHWCSSIIYLWPRTRSRSSCYA